MCCPKHVEQLRNTGIINSHTWLHLVGSFYEVYEPSSKLYSSFLAWFALAINQKRPVSLSRSILEPIQAPIKLLSRIKQPEHKADHSASSSAVAKTELHCISTSPYASWCSQDHLYFYRKRDHHDSNHQPLSHTVSLYSVHYGCRQLCLLYIKINKSVYFVIWRKLDR